MVHVVRVSVLGVLVMVMVTAIATVTEGSEYDNTTIATTTAKPPNCRTKALQHLIKYMKVSLSRGIGRLLIPPNDDEQQKPLSVTMN